VPGRATTSGNPLALGLTFVALLAFSGLWSPTQ
jgi:hypothetical protein